jgi:hypothetical protein
MLKIEMNQFSQSIAKEKYVIVNKSLKILRNH